MKNPWVIIGIVTVVLFGGAIWYSSVAGERSNEGVVTTPHIKGNPDAAVTLVEFSDLQCPACAAFQPVLNEILATHGDNLKFEYKHFPLPIHPFAQPAAIAAEAAGQQGKFFEFHDALFANQQAWSSAATPNVFFIQYAQELGLDIDKFRQHLGSSILRDKVRADMTEARELGLTGTPTFFLNGERMQIETFEDFAAQIAAAIDPSLASTTPSSSAAPLEPVVKFGL